MTPALNALATVLADGEPVTLAHYREARRIAIDLQALHVTLDHNPPIAPMSPAFAAACDRVKALTADVARFGSPTPFPAQELA